jgi:hypothetical protein
MSATHEQALMRLESLGIPLDDMSLLGGDSEGEGLIAFWHPEIGFRFLILENEALAKACYKYLLERGNRLFHSSEQLLQSATREKWPGWDTGEAFLQDLHKGANS